MYRKNSILHDNVVYLADEVDPRPCTLCQQSFQPGDDITSSPCGRLVAHRACLDAYNAVPRCVLCNGPADGVGAMVITTPDGDHFHFDCVQEARRFAR